MPDTDPKRAAAALKPPLELLERGFLEAVADAMRSGADKYGRRSYMADGKLSTYIGAVLRHALAFSAGEDLDPDSGLPHTAHLGASAMILHTLYAAGHEDDRTVLPSVAPEYTAGLLDGEGYIGLVDPRPAQRIYSRVGIQMTVRAPLDRIAATYGGTVGLYDKKPARHKPIYVWVCPRGTTEALLTDTLPHLCVKHEQARLVLDWFAVRLTGQDCYDRDDDPGEALVARCSALNKRGVDVSPEPGEPVGAGVSKPLRRCPADGKPCPILGGCRTPCTPGSGH